LIVADTDELQGDWKDTGRLDLILDIIAADTTTDIPATISTMQGNVTDILADTAEIGTAGAGLGDLGGMSAAMIAEVNAAVDAALDTAIPELGVAVPDATPTLRKAVMLMYMALRNKLDVQTSGTDALEIHNSAGTQITKKLLTDAAGDYSEAKMS